jgi:hypothetical protein
MTFQQWITTISSKVQSLWNLHALLPSNMSFFIMLSSMVGVFGNSEQSNYAAGNTFQDALTLHRISRGQKSVSIRLGLMDEIGFVAEGENYIGLKAPGVANLSEAEFLAVMDHYCNAELGLLSPLKSLPIVGLETPAVLRSRNQEPPYWMNLKTFSPLGQLGSTLDSPLKNTETVDHLAELTNATSIADAAQVVVSALVTKLSKSLAIPETELDTNKPLHAYGVDSLLGIELHNWFPKKLGLDMAVFEIMGATSISALSAIAAEKNKTVIDILNKQVSVSEV